MLTVSGTIVEVRRLGAGPPHPAAAGSRPLPLRELEGGEERVMAGLSRGGGTGSRPDSEAEEVGSPAAIAAPGPDSSSFPPPRRDPRPPQNGRAARRSPRR